MYRAKLIKIQILVTEQLQCLAGSNCVQRSEWYAENWLDIFLPALHFKLGMFFLHSPDAILTDVLLSCYSKGRNFKNLNLFASLTMMNIVIPRNNTKGFNFRFLTSELTLKYRFIKSKKTFILLFSTLTLLTECLNCVADLGQPRSAGSRTSQGQRPLVTLLYCKFQSLVNW